MPLRLGDYADGWRLVSYRGLRRLRPGGDFGAGRYPGPAGDGKSTIEECA